MLIQGKRASSNWIRKFGVLLDTQNKTYKKQETFFGIHFGEWKILPIIDYILIFKTLYVKCETCTIEDIDDQGIYQLSFVYNKNRKLIIHESNNKQEVFKLAKNLAQEFKVSMRDSASNRRKAIWLSSQSA